MPTTCCKFCSCLLLWRVQCTGGKLSLRNKNRLCWRMSQVDQRFFCNPCHLPFPTSHVSWQPIRWRVIETQALLLSSLVSRWSRRSPVRPRTDPAQRSADIESRLNGCPSQWIWAPTEQYVLLPSSPDLISSLHLFPGVILKICLRLYSEDTHYKKEILTQIHHTQLWCLNNSPLYLHRTTHSVCDSQRIFNVVFLAKDHVVINWPFPPE